MPILPKTWALIAFITHTKHASFAIPRMVIEFQQNLSQNVFFFQMWFGPLTVTFRHEKWPILLISI